MGDETVKVIIAIMLAIVFYMLAVVVLNASNNMSKQSEEMPQIKTEEIIVTKNGLNYSVSKFTDNSTGTTCYFYAGNMNTISCVR